MHGNSYSVKTSLFQQSDGSVLLKVLYIYEVKMIQGSSSSYNKVKTVFDSKNGEKLNIVRYKGIFDKLIQKLSKKYALTKIVI